MQQQAKDQQQTCSCLLPTWQMAGATTGLGVGEEINSFSLISANCSPFHPSLSLSLVLQTSFRLPQN